MGPAKVGLIENKLIELEKEVEELRRIIILSRLKVHSIKSEINVSDNK